MKNNIQGKGYNKGDKYEDKITNILIDKGILPEDYKKYEKKYSWLNINFFNFML